MISWSALPLNAEVGVAVGVAVFGGAWLGVLVARVRREIPPTRAAFDNLRRDLRPALLELRTQTERTRSELARRERER